ERVVVLCAHGGDEPLDDGDLTVGTGIDDEPGEHGDARTGDRVGDHDGLRDDAPGGDTDDRRCHEGAIDLGEHVGRVLGKQFGLGVDVQFGKQGGGDLHHGADALRAELVEVELVDPAVPPDLLLG